MQPEHIGGDTRRSRLVWCCVLVSLVLGAARSAFWEYRHDEGTTFDIALHEMAVGEYIEDWPAAPLSMAEVIDRLEDRNGYTVGDTVSALSTDYRTIHPPAYYIAVNLWTRLFGSGRLAMRLPAIVLTALAVLGMAAIARRVLPYRHAAVWVAALFAVSPWVISITNLARPYQLPLVLGIWATVLVLALYPDGSGSRSRRRWLWWAFGACSLLGLYSVYHYGFVLAWHVCLLALFALRSAPERRRGEWRALSGCVIGIVVGFAPWFPALRTHLMLSSGGRNYFEGTVLASRATDKALATLTDFAFADTFEAPGGDVLVVIAAVLGLLTLPLLLWALLGKPRRRLDPCARAFWIMTPAMPLLLGLADLLLGSHTVFVTKICFGFIILLILAVVYAWLVVPSAPLRTAGLAAWVLLLATASVMGTSYRATMDNEIEAAAKVLAQDDSPTHLVVFSTDLRGYCIPMLLTMRDAGLTNVAISAARQEDLDALLEMVERKGIYKRVSLVNHYLPYSKGKLMWDHSVAEQLMWKVKRRGWCMARASQPWGVDDWQPPVANPGDGLTSWLFGPLAVRCIHGPR